MKDIAQRTSTKKSGIVGRITSLPKPSMVQVAIILVLVLLVVLSFARIVGLISELREVRSARAELENKRATLEARHADLEAQAQYIADPDNLEKELRSRYNYKKPGENVIVVVPPKDASSTTSTNP